MQLYHRRKRQQELQIRSEFNPGEMISQLDNMVKDRLQGGSSANGCKDNLGGGIGGHPPLVLQGMQLYFSKEIFIYPWFSFSFHTLSQC